MTSPNLDPKDPNMEHKPAITVEVAFGEIGVEGRQLGEALNEQINFAERGINIFERRVFGFFENQ